MKIFSERLKDSRQDLGMSQKEVADSLGITASAYANYEQNLREPSLTILAKICETLDVSADYLLGIEDWV